MKYRFANIICYSLCFYILFGDIITYVAFDQQYYAKILEFISLQVGVSLTNNIELSCFYACFVFVILLLNYVVYRKNLIAKKTLKIVFVFYFLHLIFVLFLFTFFTVNLNGLSANTNKSGLNDNPSPYINDGSNFIDLGQVLYGFESIYYQPHEPISNLLGTSMPPINTYSQGYEGYPVKIINDLAGWLANVATAPADLFVHLLNGGASGNSPFGEKYKGPTPPTLQYYYDASNLQADMFGNADSIGIYRAYQVLNENPTNTDLKLSDVFTLYYKGAGALRSGISLLATPTFNRFTLTDRWKIFSLFYGFLEEPTPGNFNWVPDDATKFSNLKAPYNSTTNPSGKDYDNRLYNFAEFWYNRREEFSFTVSNLIFETFLFDETKFKSSGDFANTTKSEEQWMLDELDQVFNNIFLIDLKNKTI